MAYQNPIYLFAFLPLALIAYQCTPKKYRWVTLLLADYVFFITISRHLVLYLIGTTLFVYGMACWIDKLKGEAKKACEGLERKEASLVKQQYKKKQKTVLIAAMIVLIGVVLVLKYTNFFGNTLADLLGLFGASYEFKPFMLLVPIGISFYTLEAIGYLVDVYWDKVKFEKHIGKLALFLSFFPQTMEGPIALYSQTADQLWEGKSLDADNLAEGAIRIVWGLLKKIVIADRLYYMVTELYTNYEKYHGIMIVVAAVAYTVQLYMEFSGCMDIIIGSGKLFGITLPENFNQPFVSKNAAEFWRRWHMTLGVWFKTYIFYPVSVSGVVKKWNKYGKKHLNKYITKLGVSACCLFPVWMCNGLWHGPTMNYIAYGVYYFVVLLFGVAVDPLRDRFLKRFHIDEEALYWKIPRILKTWVVIFTGELLFRANGLRVAGHMYASLFRDFSFKPLWDGSMMQLSFDLSDYVVVAAGIIIVAIVGSIRERKLLHGMKVSELKLPVRWVIYYALIMAVILFGAYGVGHSAVDLIYAGF